MSKSDPRVAERLRARHRRVTLIRRRVLAATAATFVLVWGVIFAQLVSGHDPALASKTTSTTTSASTPPTTSSSTSSGSTATTTSGSSGAVTTSQS